MSSQKVSLQELSSEIGIAWARALRVYANVPNELVEKPKSEWMDLLERLKAVKTNIK